MRPALDGVTKPHRILSLGFSFKVRRFFFVGRKGHPTAVCALLTYTQNSSVRHEAFNGLISKPGMLLSNKLP